MNNEELNAWQALGFVDIRGFCMPRKFFRVNLFTQEDIYSMNLIPIISSVGNSLEYGLGQGLSTQVEIDAENVLRSYVRNSLELVAVIGVNRLGEFYRVFLEYGLERGWLTQDAIDKNNEISLIFHARLALGFVATSGVEQLGETSKAGLQYGLEHGLFTQAEIDAEQAKYIQ
jgi:hypothetical protein